MWPKIFQCLTLYLLASNPSYAEKYSLSQEHFLPTQIARAKIGQLLFYDKILSGNRNISCSTCHHPKHGGGDGLSLGIGEGGVGLGPKRSAGTGDSKILKRIPRNSSSLWNLGHESIKVVFHDGRLEISDIYENGFNSPAQEWLPDGLDTIIAAQALFPLVAQFEMAGNPKENEIAGAVHDRIDAAWPILAKRVRIIPEYGEMFVKAFSNIDAPEQVSIVEIANALGDFINFEWQSFDSPYDELVVNGIDLSDGAERGRKIFFGRGECYSCHRGPLFTDQNFYALSLPAFGPGRTRLFDPTARDTGRMGESDKFEDAYRFKTPSLRNVALTAPYGHNGAYPSLEGIVRHHLDPIGMRAKWTRDMANLPPAPWLEDIDFVVQSDQREINRQKRLIDINKIDLSDDDVSDIIIFLESLTGKTAELGRLGIPDKVPSGLSID